MAATISMVKWAQWHTQPFQKGFLQQWRSDSKSQGIHITPHYSSYKSVPPLVATEEKTSQLPLDHSYHNMGHDNLGCKQQGLGHSLPIRSSTGQMEFPFSQDCVQHPGTSGCLSGASSIPSSNKELLSDAQVGQYNHGGIRRQGGTCSWSLLQEVEPIMSWAQRNLSNISAVYIPGIQNVQPDFLSRVQMNNNEWSLHKEVFEWLLTLGVSRSTSATRGSETLRRVG